MNAKLTLAGIDGAIAVLEEILHTEDPIRSTDVLVVDMKFALQTRRSEIAKEEK